MADDASLYDRDFFAWTEQQAGRIRSAASTQLNLLIDWNEVAEEIEDLGKSLERELQSRLATIIEHLLKLQHSPTGDPHEGWQSTVLRERREVRLLLKQSPSLRRKVSAMLPDAGAEAARDAARGLETRGEIDRRGVQFVTAQMLAEEQVMGDWLPGRTMTSSEASS